MTSPELLSEQNETLRKIGRNVLHFQRMEAMLKFLVSRSSLKGDSIEELKGDHAKQVEAVSRVTMGNLVKALFSSIYRNSIGDEEAVNEISEKRFSLSITVESNPEAIEQQRASLERIVEERNHLIHQMLLDFDQSSIQSCRNFSAKLDEQAERLRPDYEALLNLIQAIRSGVKTGLSE